MDETSEISSPECEMLMSQIDSDTNLGNGPSLREIPPSRVQRSGLTFHVVIASAVAAIGGLLFGYDTGIISGALLLLSKNDTFHLTCLDQELVVGSMLIGAVLGASIGGYLIDQFGRRRMILANGCLFVVGGLILALSPSFPVLIVGRVLVGMAVSMSAIADCIYISEIAPPAIRGMLVSMNELAITSGFLLAYLINYTFIHTTAGWRYMFGLSVLPCILQVTAMLFLPESPRHYILKGKDTQAEKVLKLIRKTSDVQTELQTMKSSVTAEREHSMSELFSSKNNMRGRLFIVVGLAFLQQMSGQPNMLLYTPMLFGTVGFVTNSAKTLATVGVGVVKFLATVAALIVLDRIGRRSMLMFGSFIMALSAACIAIVASIGGGQVDTKICVDNASLTHNSTPMVNANASVNTVSHYTEVEAYISFVAVMLFVAAYSLSFGPGTWLIMTEIFPTPIRGRAMAVAMVVNWLTNALVSFTFITLIGALHIQWTFSLYTIICLTSTLFIFLLVPETKNRPLEQISADLSHSSISSRLQLAWHLLKTSCGGRRVVTLWFSSPHRYSPVTNDHPDDDPQL